MKLTYSIIRSDRKTLALQVRDGQLIVRAPRKTPVERIERFVREQAPWIERQMKKAAEQRQRSEALPPLYPQDINRLGELAKQIIPQRVAYYAARLGVTYGRITIRNQRTRWGSCSAEGNLNFNCLLMLAPTQVLDSVIVHELCHRKEMNHSARFYQEVRKVFPEYDRWHGWLKQNGNVLLDRMERGAR